MDIYFDTELLNNGDRKLFVFDMDSTLIEQEVIDLLAKHANQEAAVSKITAAAMAGDLDFAQALKSRVALLADLDVSVIAKVRKEILLTTGAEKLIQTLHAQGHKVGVVSGGFIDVIEPILKDLKIDFSGIRPKIKSEDNSFQDFIIDYGDNNIINLDKNFI